ncbi:MAG TPA: GAF domain-containing sensor histidine kinase [Anaerolineaceae bacterium]|nr:GAF domain-containing sensor histidine kinase [Anaerolineaceae bacterium]
MNESSLPSISPSVELDNLYAISQITARSTHWKPALDQIIPLVRAILIFDNLVLYLPDANTQSLEVAYARVVGRGRSAGPDLAWGETVANQVFNSGQIYLQQPQPDKPIEERLNYPYLLGLPLTIHERTFGVVVFIRFGGPAYDSNHTRIASFVSEHIAQLVEHQQLKQQTDQLEAERKQARLQEDFISTISHELLTPLGFIKGYTTTLLRPDTSWDLANQREFLTIVDEETDRLQELIDNLLDSARLQSGTLRMQFTPVRLDAMLKDVVMRAKVQHRDLDIRIDLDGPLSPLQGDPSRLAQVFENLINNAIKYAPGTPIIISVRKEDDQAHITVQDSGPGIPAQYLPHVFERFFRNPEQAPNVRGTGLGLYICRQIVDAHHGEISVESFLGEGTTFHIWLPFEQNATPTSLIKNNQTETR